MPHKLLLSTYSFQYKKIRARGGQGFSVNEFLEHAYPQFERKFLDGFIADVVDILSTRLDNKQGTHGGILLEKSFSEKDRFVDLMINGGLTGIKRFMIDEDGNQTDISDKNIVGLKFFVRFWLPSQSNSAFMFMQHYDHLNIKPIYDQIIKEVGKKHNVNLVGTKLYQTSTEKRIKEFVKFSKVQEIRVISKKSRYQTSSVNVESTNASIKIGGLVNIDIPSLSLKKVKDLSESHGFSIEGRDYKVRASLVSEKGSSDESKSIDLYFNEEENFNIIPRIELPDDCYDVYNHPRFDEMKSFVNNEIEQIKRESKL